MVIGRTIRLMVWVFTHIWMGPDTKVPGGKISNTVKVSRPGQMVLATRATMLMVKSMVMVNLPGLMAALMMGSSLKTILMVMVCLILFMKILRCVLVVRW